jgi:hypothetical protein
MELFMDIPPYLKNLATVYYCHMYVIMDGVWIGDSIY